MSAIFRGQYRIRTSSFLADAARVETDVLSLIVPAAVYIDRGIEPPFEDLPWREDIRDSAERGPDIANFIREEV